MERDLNYGIYTEKLLGLRRRCDERGCTGWMDSTGFLRFSWKFPPERSWTIEYQCTKCGSLSLVREREKIPLVRDIFRPLFDDVW